MADYAEEEIVENPTLRAAYNLAPLHQNQPLRWDYEVNLIGEKVYDSATMIHLCEICELPILVYGRMLPCKHIFCFDCARKCDTLCRRCNNKVQKVEKSALRTVFVCTHGAPRHNTKGCRRTYLSQRDLQSHISHRHVPKPSSSSTKAPAAVPPVQPAPNQLPLTQQQAAQQAAQKPSPAPAHAAPSHPPNSGVPGLGLLAPVASGHPPSSNLQDIGQQSSPVAPLIPGLGDIRPMISVAQPAMSLGSPLLQPAASPGAMPQGMGNTMPQGIGNAMSQEMGNSMSQGMGNSLPHGMGNSVLQGMGNSMSHGMRNTMSHAIGNSMSQGMGNTMSQGMGNAVSPGMGNAMSPGMGNALPQGRNPMSQGMNISPGMNNTLSPGMGGPVPQDLAMSYSGAGGNPDRYRPLDMPNIGQQHQPQQLLPQQQQPQQQHPQQQHHHHHQTLGLNNPHLQSGQSMQAYGQSPQFPASTAMVQQLNSQQLTTMAGHMHPTPHPHQHSPVPMSQPPENFSKHPSMSTAGPSPQSRTNLNLITVPIQDEGQYRPLPYVNPTMGSQSNASNFPPTRPGLGVQSPAFSQSVATSSSAFPPMGSQAQSLAGTSNSPGLPFNQSSGMRANSPGLLSNPRPGMTGNMHPNMPRALAGMVQAAMNMARAQGGGGLMPTPGSMTPGAGFPAGRWASPRVLQPRMNQGPQRPRTESQFNQGPYYS